MKTGCPNCGANIVFLPDKQQFHCEYCGKDSDIHDLDKVELEEDASQVKYDECTCSSCGAKLIVGENTTITVCVYCGSNQIITNRFTGNFKPDEILPFKLDQKAFINKYQTFVKKKILAPNEFRQNHIINEIKGLYVPFYLYVLNSEAYARGRGHYHSNKTDYYKYFEMSFHVQVVSPQDASQKLDDNIMTSLEPFNIENMEPFHPAYLNGFSSENGDEKLEELDKKARIRGTKECINLINKRLGRYSYQGGVMNTNFEQESRKYVLLPVWFFNTEYRGQKYEYAVNGQTGKVVGRIPLSKVKFAILMIAMIIMALKGYTVDDDIGHYLIAATIATFIIVKRRYRNVKDILENSILSRKYEENNYDEFSKWQYGKKYPNDSYTRLDATIMNDNADYLEETKKMYAKTKKL